MESTPLKILTVEEIKKKSTSEISELKKSIEEDIKNKFKYLSTVIEHGISNKYLIYEKYIDELHNESGEFIVNAMGGGECGYQESKSFDNFEDALYCAQNYKNAWIGGKRGCNATWVILNMGGIWEWQSGNGERIYDYEYFTVNLLNGMINDEIRNIDKIFDSINKHVNGVEKSREKYKLKVEKQTLSNVLDKKFP